MSRADGPAAETAALAFLERHGLELVERNWRCRFGEIDLVLRDGATLVFVEVRLRKDSRFGGAAESIDWHKRNRLLAAARLYLMRCPNAKCRFDAVLLR